MQVQEALFKFSLSHFVCLSGSHSIEGKYCKHSVFLNIFRYQDYARHTLYCSIDNHIFFMTTPTRNMAYFSVLLVAKRLI